MAGTHSVVPQDTELLLVATCLPFSDFSSSESNPDSLAFFVSLSPRCHFLSSHPKPCQYKTTRLLPSTELPSAPRHDSMPLCPSLSIERRPQDVFFQRTQLPYHFSEVFPLSLVPSLSTGALLCARGPGSPRSVLSLHFSCCSKTERFSLSPLRSQSSFVAEIKSYLYIPSKLFQKWAQLCLGSSKNYL